MMWLMALRLAIRALGRNKLRATLTILGILVGVGAFVVATAMGAGAQERIKTQFTSIGLNLIMVFPGASTSGGARGGQGTAAGLTEDDARAIAREVPSVSAVAPMLSASVQIVYGARNTSTRVIGTTPEFFAVRAWNTTAGTVFGDAEMRSSGKVCVLGQSVRTELFGRADPIGATIRVGRMPCTVIGVLEVKGESPDGRDQDDTLIIPMTTFRTRVAHRPGRQVNMMWLSARDPRLVRRAQAAVTALLRQRHRLAPEDENDFFVRNQQELSRMFEESTGTLAFVLLAVASLSLLVGGIGVMNIMLVSVTERTREIGIRLAIGARGGDILAQFLVEAVALSSIGGFAGLALGWGVSRVVGKNTQFVTLVQPDAAITAMLIAGGIGVVFGFFPARRAAKMDPITALRHE